VLIGEKAGGLQVALTGLLHREVGAGA